MDRIDEMPAGREMDELVIRKILGWDGPIQAKWSPSTDIGAAWEVVDKMRLSSQAHGHYGCAACVEIHSSSCANENVIGDRNGLFWACIWGEDGEAETAPLAICRAALKATLTP